MAEGMVLADLIKNPNGDLYDPSQDLPDAQKRWGYTKDQMHKLGWMTDAQYATIQYPKKGDYIEPKDPLGAQMDTPTGFIVHHVMSELMPGAVQGQSGVPSTRRTPDSLQERRLPDQHDDQRGGAEAAEDLATRTRAGLADDEALPKTLGGRARRGATGHRRGARLLRRRERLGHRLRRHLQRPGRGRVGGWTGANQPPGSTFKTVTMATALSQGISVDSYWDGPETKTFPDRTIAGEQRRGRGLLRWCALSLHDVGGPEEVAEHDVLRDRRVQDRRPASP